jgi:hypothetical protein
LGVGTLFAKMDLRMARPDYGCATIHPQSGFAIRRSQNNSSSTICSKYSREMDMASEVV